MGFAIVAYDDYQLIKVAGYLDSHSTESQQLSQILTRSSVEIPTHSVLDLSAVEYVNSTTLGLFVRFLGEAQKAERQVLILNPNASVRSVLEMTGLSVVLPVVETESEALSILGRDRGASREVRDDLNYEDLTDELESIILGESDVDEEGELGKLLNEADDL